MLPRRARGVTSTLAGGRGRDPFGRGAASIIRGATAREPRRVLKGAVMTGRNWICSTLALALALAGCGSPGRDASGTGDGFGTEALGVTLGDVIYLVGVQSGRVSLDIESKSNVIIRNIALREVNPSLIEAGDGLTINTSHHVWIDRCSFSNISDGYADIRYGSKAVTLSYNHIDGRNTYVCGGQHNFISLVSDSDVTFNNNYFDHVGGRNPKVTDVSRVHLYNNYYDSVSYFCASSGASSQLLVENNHYYNSRYPHWNEGGIIEASGNVYAGSTSTGGRDTSGDAFTPPYSYSKGSASALNSSVPAHAGIGKL
jgi:pectate lyase